MDLISLAHVILTGLAALIAAASHLHNRGKDKSKETEDLKDSLNKNWTKTLRQDADIAVLKERVNTEIVHTGKSLDHLNNQVDDLIKRRVN